MIKITETLFYNPTTGVAWYTVPKNYSRVLTAKDTKGYIHAKVGPNKVRLHRLVWSVINGPIPDGMHIDHIDCNKRNNAISNLRMVDPLTNARNRIPPKNSSGYPGVSWCAKRRLWKADISVLDKTVWSCCGNDARVVYNKYWDAKAKYHGIDSLRHYPAKIDTSSYSVAKYTHNTGYGRGCVRCRKPKPKNYDYFWRVEHGNKVVFKSRNEEEARAFAINLRAELDNKKLQDTSKA